MTDELNETPLVDGHVGEQAPEGQAPEDAVTPPEGDTQTTPNTDEGDGGKTDAELKRARKEAAEYRTKLRAAEKQLEEAKRAELSELERAQEDAKAATEKAAAAEKKARTKALQAAAQAAATRNGFASPELALQLVKDGVEFDDDGEPIGVADLVKSLAEKHPELVAKNGSYAGGGAGAVGANGLPVTETREERNERLGLSGSGPSFF